VSQQNRPNSPQAQLTQTVIGDDVGELQLSSDDYLQGVIGMVNELPRLSVNAVTAQNFALPGRIAAFVGDVFTSYSMVRIVFCEWREV
jgi:predicted translin family RNA/ssDNA-binding protein